MLVRRFERFGDLPGIGSASSIGIGPCAMRSASVAPSTSSITSALTPPDPGIALESVDRGDVRMIQRRQHFGFALKARQSPGIGRKRAGRILIAT